MSATGEMLAREAEKLPALSIPYRAGGGTVSGMDCQGLVEYCLGVLGIRRNWKGSNAMYRDVRWRGTPEECVRAFGRIPKGALLFILEQDGGEKARGYSDGLGNASHVGIYTGSGKGAVHASASRGCVAQSAFSGKTVPNGGWNRVGLLRELDYGADAGKEMTGMILKVYSENGGRVRLRAKPSLSAACLERVETGTAVEVLDLGDAWAHVSCLGKTGYMMRAFLKDTGDAESVQTDLERRVADLEARVRKLEEA